MHLPRTTSRLAPEIPSFFFFNDTATTEIYTLSLHDALPISSRRRFRQSDGRFGFRRDPGACLHYWFGRSFLHPKLQPQRRDRKSTRLNSSHLVISYAVFCLKKKTKMDYHQRHGPLLTLSLLP